MYTVKCESTEGVFYLVNHWKTSKTFFIEKMPEKKSQLFSREQDAKRSITMLLKVMDDYKDDKFTIITV